MRLLNPFLSLSLRISISKTKEETWEKSGKAVWKHAIDTKALQLENREKIETNSIQLRHSVQQYI